MSELECRTLKIALIPKGEPIFSERATHIEIVDEAAGEFVEVSQDYDNVKSGTIAIDSTEWPLLKSSIDRMIDDCRDENGERINDTTT